MGSFDIPKFVQKPTSHIPKKHLQIYFFLFHHPPTSAASSIALCEGWFLVLTKLGNGGHDGPVVTTELAVMVVVELDGSGYENG
ncbi:hypothetical protein CsSME_00015568 [Camellia sinensis var. sinensis]